MTRAEKYLFSSTVYNNNNKVYSGLHGAGAVGKRGLVSMRPPVLETSLTRDFYIGSYRTKQKYYFCTLNASKFSLVIFDRCSVV